MFEWLKNIFNPAQPDKDNIVEQHSPDDEDGSERYAKGSPGEDSPYDGNHDGGDDGGD
ncbi:hypothetical protein [Photobacterium rosenbergii]|uniref:Uncharacterized protein n=1 Tax=Photobacterium rosenbergii TaxID=294936 RepID=A0ABU3ZC10_9GAMM|nr:hypothetical protein [Photobacterium rosenbergii]MDV5167659.1 hypothetical protein [Photobacterium rosenbergii]